MKNLLSTITILLCTTIYLQAQNTFIRGKINNPQESFVYVKFLHNAFTNEFASFNFPIDKQGEFHAELEITIPTIAYCRYDGIPFKVFVEPQKEVGVFFDGNDLENTIEFFEKDETQNNKTWRKYDTEFDNLVFSGQVFIQPSFALSADYYKELSPLSDDDRFDYIQIKTREKSNYFIDNVKENNNTSTDFQRYLYADIYYFYLATLQALVDPGSLSKKKRHEYNSLFLRDDVNSITDLYHPMYMTFLDNYAFRLAQKRNSNDIDYYQNQSDIYKAVKSSDMLEESIKAQILGRLLFNNLTPETIDLMQASYEDFIASFDNVHIQKMVEERYALANRFASGSPAPDFELENKTGAKIKLSDYKGKKVYVLFWAKWCTYCKQEIKNATENRAKLNDDDIVFIFISIDKQKNSWLDHPITNEIDEIHLWGAAEDTNVKSDFGIVNLPISFLIDENGNFIRDFPKSDSDKFVRYIQKL